MNTTSKVPPEVRRQILEVYRTKGNAAAQALAAPYGVCEKYAMNLAAISGIRRGVNPTDWNDPRWAWAIERGPVIA